MSKKGVILKGAFILTLTGFLTRFIGFFYRIFLSQTFGEEGVGLYQLIFPVYALCFSLTSAGIETAISRTIAHKMSLGEERQARQILYTGLSVSILLSCIIMLLLQTYAGLIASAFLGDARCEPLLVIMSYSFPFAALHSCICGYCFGLKQTKIPAISQLIEQVIRVASVYILYVIACRDNTKLNISIAVFGLVAGEIASSLFCAQILKQQKKSRHQMRHAWNSYIHNFRELIPFSIPLTANRVLLNLLQSVEAVSIPSRLQMFGGSTADALSTYGVLTGMALPCILFPSAITSSISIMLLPTVAEIQAQNNRTEMVVIIQKVSKYCFLLGCACTACFLFLGNWMGTALFHSTTAGKFMITLSWICPFLYTNSTLISMINGLGKTTTSFLINTIGLLLRIASVFLLIPLFGIIGYLWGLLGSQLVISIFCFGFLSHYLKQ